jgi:hypothetical protein
MSKLSLSILSAEAARHDRDSWEQEEPQSDNISDSVMARTSGLSSQEERSSRHSATTRSPKVTSDYTQGTVGILLSDGWRKLLNERSSRRAQRARRGGSGRGRVAREWKDNGNI